METIEIDGTVYNVLTLEPERVTLQKMHKPFFYLIDTLPAVEPLRFLMTPHNNLIVVFAVGFMYTSISPAPTERHALVMRRRAAPVADFDLREKTGWIYEHGIQASVESDVTDAYFRLRKLNLLLI